MSNLKKRALPKKTIFIIGILVVFAFTVMFAEAYFKEKKIETYLNSLSYTNVTDITIFHKSKVLDPKTKKNAQLYKVKFTDLNKNKICKGLILINIKNSVQLDLDCTNR